MSVFDEEFVCKRCQQKITHQHFCTPDGEAKRFTCEYCGEENVNVRHICAPMLDEVKFYCANCGAISPSESYLCNPQPIAEVNPEQKAAWDKARKKVQGHKMIACKVCGQPIEEGAPGHVCDRKVPYTCNFCGQKIETSYHICKGMSGKYKYQCKNCGRLGITASDVCAPREL